ncbi:MAG: hypothetical protein AB7L92_08415 [Alphaproteobacteria bacterium]
MGDSKMCGSGCGGVMWWMTLLVAVLAIPSAAIIVTLLFQVEGIAQILLFVITCWLCTYLGMRLMQNPKIQESIKMDKK